MPDDVDTVTCAPDDRWRYHPKHVVQFADINKLFITVSCWTIIATYLTIYGPLNVKELHEFILNLENGETNIKFYSI